MRKIAASVLLKLFIKTPHYWRPLAHEQNSIFKYIYNIQGMVIEDQKIQHNITSSKATTNSSQNALHFVDQGKLFAFNITLNRRFINFTIALIHHCDHLSTEWKPSIIHTKHCLFLLFQWALQALCVRQIQNATTFRFRHANTLFVLSRQFRKLKNEI